MALITTGTIIVGGVILGIGVIGGIVHAATEDERKETEKEQLKAANENLEKLKEKIESVNNKIVSANSKLDMAKDCLKAGGHVLHGDPLAKNEFTSCNNSLKSAIEYEEKLVSNINATIQDNTQKINKL